MGTVCHSKIKAPIVCFVFRGKGANRADREISKAYWSAPFEPLPGGNNPGEKTRPSASTTIRTTLLVRRSEAGQDRKSVGWFSHRRFAMPPFAVTVECCFKLVC